MHANVMERINAVGVSNAGAAMNNVIQFPSRRPEACPICEERPRGRQERLLIEYIPFKEGVLRRLLAGVLGIPDGYRTDPTLQQQRGSMVKRTQPKV